MLILALMPGIPQHTRGTVPVKSLPYFNLIEELRGKLFAEY